MQNNSEKSFSKKFIILISGTIGTYFFPIIFSPFLTRIYTPDDFALFTIYMTAVQIISVVSTLKYELGIPLVKNHQERISLFQISTINTVLISFLIFLSIKIYIFFGFSYHYSLRTWTYTIPSGVILMSLFHQILYNWLLYNQKFSYISSAKILFGFSNAILPIILYKIANLKGFFYLVASHQIGLSLGTISILLLLLRKITFKNFITFFIFKTRDLVHILKKYKKYVLFSSPSTLMNTISIWIPVIFIWIFFDAKYASLFFLSHRIVNLPMMVLGHAIGKIFYSRASIDIEEGVLKQNIVKYFKILFHIAFLCLIVCLFLAPNLFSFIYGSDWSESGKIVQILSPWLFFTLLASPISTIPTILYKQEIEFKFQTILLIVRFVGLLIGSMVFQNLYVTLILFSITSSIVWMIYLFYILKLSEIKVAEIISSCLINKNEYLLFSVVAFLVSYLIKTPLITSIAFMPILTYMLYSIFIEIRKM